MDTCLVVFYDEIYSNTHHKCDTQKEQDYFFFLGGGGGGVSDVPVVLIFGVTC